MEVTYRGYPANTRFVTLASSKSAQKVPRFGSTRLLLVWEGNRELDMQSWTLRRKRVLNADVMLKESMVWNGSNARCKKYGLFSVGGDDLYDGEQQKKHAHLQAC